MYKILAYLVAEIHLEVVQSLLKLHRIAGGVRSSANLSVDFFLDFNLVRILGLPPMFAATLVDLLYLLCDYDMDIAEGRVFTVLGFLIH